MGTKRERPTEPMTLRQFLERIAQAQQEQRVASGKVAGQRDGNTLKSCLKADDAKPSSTKKTARYCTNPRNDKVWCLVKPVSKFPEECHADLWWNEQEMFDRSAKDEDLAAIVENQFVTILEHSYESIRAKGETYDIKHNAIHEVKLDTEALKECAAARGLESLVNPSTKRTVRKHCRAVLAAQELLRVLNKDMGEPSSLKLIAEASARYSHASRVFVKKIALFDQEVSEEYLKEDYDNIDDESIWSFVKNQQKSMEEVELPTPSLLGSDVELGKESLLNRQDSELLFEGAEAAASNVISQ
eukprot:CAMPEP_0172450424 /NCGR_PEP_ID=MMETSP1065-20121228/8765_1 /TAXON_ID=265537 /ORGANISM="Amphiprora paludosa, Strain CCMP125" /LENGTH=300 /DNA_ID=CAMNT_0013202205 /DNA_START=35 /DNA_END=937 /DNA_ORIENTATION=+